ncbi:hypothetical protein [Cellulomonas iranensis]|uniref:hypothetical protein n=1 Tax=Cellulomonas iranensis TaxID=76862 RepID=UPI0013D5E5B8|nr:hypothetical protein [Cellulomonas iranensis]
MAGTSIPSTVPDVEAWLIQTLGPAVAPAPVRNMKPDQKPPYSCVVVRADLQNRVTPVSRYCRVGVQAWKVTANQKADLAGARELCAAAATALELATRAGILLDAQIDAGPYRVVDATSGIEYQYASVLLEIAV